ncbi:hypothetical protein [Sulfurimonas sp.]|uniref:hypothetical protein n=1 Tax=Sulfurimonas sp. TaxID=2022749 RepID=UPI0025FF38AC|nr:hypothetical protein [Sulfurimonas sp.]
MSSKLVACKTCKKEVAKGAKVCPHCGEKNPTVSTKDIIGGVLIVLVFIWIVSAIISEEATYENSKNKTLKEATQLSLGSLKKITSSYVKEKQIPSSYNDMFYNCLGQLIYDKDKTFTIEKMMDWCHQDYTSSNGKLKDYYNTAELFKDFSAYDGTYRPLELLIKNSMQDSSSYEHIDTSYRLVYYGTERPYMFVETKYKGKNSFGAIVKAVVTAKVDAKTKDIFEVK